MPFNPVISDFGGKFTAAAGAEVGADIRNALQRYEEEKKKREFNDGIFEVLKDQTDSEGNPVISPDALSRWNSINPDKQAGILSAAGAKLQQDQKTKLAKMQIDAANQTSPFAGQKIYDDSGTDIGVWDERGNAHLYPGGPASSRTTPEMLPVVDPNSKKVIPGKGLNSKTGQVVDLTEGHPMAGQIFYDPETGEPRGVHKQNGDISFFPKKATVDPLKEAIAGQITGAPPSATPRVEPTPLPQRPSSAAAPTPSPIPNAPVINSEQDYAALPPGQTYVDGRDGKLKRKKAAGQ